MWWIAQLIACAACSVKHGIMRSYGWGLAVLGVIVLISIVIEGGFWVSQQNAPSFWKPWFLGVALLSLFGALISIFWFKESINIYGWVGASLAVGGSILLIFK